MAQDLQTKEAVQREYLTKEAESSRTTQIFSATTGLMGVTNGAVVLSTETSRKLKIIGVSSIALGVASFVLSYLGGRWAKKAEDQIKQLDIADKHVARYQQEQSSNTAAKTP